MLDDSDDSAGFATIAISLIALAVGLAVGTALLPRHPPLVVRRVGRQLNTPVAALPLTGEHLEQRNGHLAHGPQANHRVHHDDPVAALPPPSPPPPYPAHILDTRIDGPAPSYSNIGSSQGSTVGLVPFPNQAAS